MNTCTTCEKCKDTACACPAKVAPYRPVDGGNFWLIEPEPEPTRWWPAILTAASLGTVAGIGYAAARYFFGG